MLNALNAFSLASRRTRAHRPGRHTRDTIHADPAARSGRSPFAFEAGQAALIGPAGQNLRIPYSIASAPIEAVEHGWLDFLIKVEPSGRWGQQFAAVSPGARIGIQGPVGSFLFPVDPPERHFLFIAGGTGIAPIRAMIRQALLRGQAGRMRLLYSAKTGDDFAYLPELVNMATLPRMEGAWISGCTSRAKRQTPGKVHAAASRHRSSPPSSMTRPRSASSAVPKRWWPTCHGC